jgi:hypothetical protein
MTSVTYRSVWLKLLLDFFPATANLRLPLDL